MAYETRAYDLPHDDGFGPAPCVVLVVTGTHDVSRLMNLFSQGVIEQIQVAEQLKRQVNRHGGGRAALKLLAKHGGPDLLERLETTTNNAKEGHHSVPQFVKFTETNDHEGESWNFWLQVDGNEDAIAKLRNLVDKLANNSDSPYEFADETTPESEVDAAVKHTATGYMAFENKCVGVLTLPDDIDDDLDGLYKGGIGDLFEAAS